MLSLATIHQQKVEDNNFNGIRKFSCISNEWDKSEKCGLLQRQKRRQSHVTSKTVPFLAEISKKQLPGSLSFEM